MLGKLFKSIGKLGTAIAPVAIAMAEPAALINFAGGFIAKHTNAFPNSAIPALNLAASVGMAWGRNGWDMDKLVPSLMEGGALMAASTGMHQTAKMAIRELPISSAIAESIGPGKKISI